MSKSAFTTIELLVVVSIILILASIAAPRLLRQPADANLVAALTELELLCQCAQHIAMASNENQKIMLDQQARRCTLTTKHHTWHVDLPETCRFGFSPSALGQPGDPREKITQAVTFPTENNTFVIIFDPTGLISAGTAYIIDKQESQLGALTCGVSQVSYLRKYLYKNRSWQLLN